MNKVKQVILTASILLLAACAQESSKDENKGQTNSARYSFKDITFLATADGS